MPTPKPSADQHDIDWKERYRELKTRLASAKDGLAGTRRALEAAAEREAVLRAKLVHVQERLRWHERALLRPEVLRALLPERAAWRRRTPADPAALAREAAHILTSPSYAAAREAPAPEGADHVEIAGLSWWVPLDSRRAGRLADRVLAGKHLPLVDILRTREAIANGVMLDIGGNIGLTSVTRVVCGDMDVVYAAEPAPDNYACLVRNVVDNGLRGLVLPDRVAISDEDGVGRLQLSGSIGGHALAARGDVDVRTCRLDTWVSQLGIDADAVRYVKVDTQGREAHVLAGAPALLARQGVVWELEFSPRHLRRAQRDPRDLIAQMQTSFTHFVDLTPEAPGKRVRPIAELPEGVAYLDDSFTNILAYRSPA